MEIVLSFSSGPGEEWKEVRHVPKGHTWYQATDQLEGTDSYGVPNNASNQWSVPFKDDDFSEFLFITGDAKFWMVMDKDEVLDWYNASNEPR